MKKFFPQINPFLTFLILVFCIVLSRISANPLNNTDAFPIRLQGQTLPEQASVHFYVNKPLNATGSVTLTLMVSDADNQDEGKLEINGAGPLQLFGGQASSKNDGRVVPITLTTTVDWWNDGRNTLRFVHWRGDGFRIDSASVEFKTMPSGFPIALQGKSLPEQETAYVYVHKPANAAGSVLLTLKVFDADILDEGRLEINGAGPIQLFGPQVSFRNDSLLVPITLTTPVNWWNDGRNMLQFVHWRGDGFRIDSASVEFETTPFGFPVALRGNVLPEHGVILMNVTKPSGSMGNATLNLMVFDADTAAEGQLEINGNRPIRLFGNQARSKNDRKTVPIRLTTLADWWNNGINRVRFIHTRKDGYRIESASVTFEKPQPSTENIVTQTVNPISGSPSQMEDFQESVKEIISESDPDKEIVNEGWEFGDEEEIEDPHPAQLDDIEESHITEVVGQDDIEIENSHGDIEGGDDKDSRIAVVAKVGKWQRHVITLNNSTYSGNPFELEVDGMFTHANSGTEIRVPGYYRGSDAWSVAFMPTLIGQWRYETVSIDSDLDGVQGMIDCIDSGHPGMLKADPVHPRKWKYTDGPYVVPIGLLFSLFLEPGNKADFTRVASFLKDDVNGHLFNFRLTNLAFAGDWQDHTFDLTLWNRLEERMDILTERGLGIQIMLYTNTAGKPNWEGQSDTEKLLIRYMIARLAAYPVVIFNTGIDVHEFRDQTWVDWYGSQVQSLDPYDHPVSSRHSGDGESFAMGTQSFDSRDARTTKINQLIDHYGKSSVPISLDDHWDKDRTSRVIFSPSDIRRSLWKAVLAGGVALHIRDEILSSHDDANDPDFWFNSHDITTALESEQWLRLVNPFIQKKLGKTFGAMTSENSLVANGFALADPLHYKILCFLMGVNDQHDTGNGGVLTARLPDPEAEYSAIWFDPRTGEEILIGNFRGGNNHVISPPNSDDWVLLFEKNGNPFPAVFQGQNLPEEGIFKLDVKKTAGVTGYAGLTLMSFDADIPDEGELEINGHGPIKLFGSQANFRNDSQVVPVTFMTPADWWNDGRNTLRFIHWRTDGYRIDSAKVEFGVIPSNFPVVLQGNIFPEEATLELDIKKPFEATGNATLNLMVFDADIPDEGDIEINGYNFIQLFCEQASFRNNESIVPITLDTPAEWWRDGANTLRFIHTRTGGYRIESASVNFELSSENDLIASTGTNEDSESTENQPTKTIYEDAEDGTTKGWFLYNGGSLKNILGGANGSMRAIEIKGDRGNDVFRLGNENGSDWNNSTEFFAEFSVVFDAISSGVIYFKIATSKGIKYLVYTNGQITNNNDSNMIYLNLGDLAYGKWHTIRRDLRKDLTMTYRYAKLEAVKGIFVYGSLKLDNLMLFSHNN